MWLVEYSEEADHFVKTNLADVANVIRAVIRLMLTNDGQPTEGVVESWKSDTYRWIVGEYELFIRQEKERTVIEMIRHQKNDWTEFFRP